MRRDQGRIATICLLACKDLRWNSRIVRQAYALSQRGHQVSVAALGLPADSLRAQTANVEYVAVASGGWMRPVQASWSALQQIRSMSRKAAGRLGRSGSGRGRALIQPRHVFLHVVMHRAFAGNVVRLLGKRRFDCVQAHDVGALHAADRLRSRCGGAIVYDAVETPHDDEAWPGSGIAGWLRRREARIEADLIRSADRILTVSPSLVRHIAEHHDVAPPDLVRNCQFYRPPGRDSRIRRDAGLPDDAVLVLYLNSLYEGQGLEQLVSASVRLPAHIHVATLGPEAQRGYLAHLLDYVDRQEAGARFHVLPPIAPDDMIAYASGADIGIVPRQNININNRLSLPNRVLEMVMARLPIATSRLPDIEALVAECELGLVFDETDPDDIAHVLQIMAEPERLAVFRMNADRAANDLSWENESKCYVAAIENTLAAAA